MSARASASPFATELVATLRLAAPLALSNLLQMAVFATDVIFIARLGQQDLAASSLAVAVIAVMMMGLSGMTSAVAPIIAAEIGRKRHAVREVRRSVRMGLWLATGLGLCAVLICLQGEQILIAIGQTPRLAARAGPFMAVLALSLPFMAASQVLRLVVSAMGRPSYAMIITALSILVNACGNYLFVFGHFGMPAFGLVGSAIASVVTSMISVLVYIVVLHRHRRLRRYRLIGRWWRPEWSRLRDMVRLGTPIALTLLAEGSLFSAATLLIGRLGEIQLAAHTLALQIASIAFQVPFGIGQAATIRVGYQYGAGDRDGVTRAGWSAIALGMAFMALSSGAMLMAPRLLLSAYVTPDDPANTAIIPYALDFLTMAAIFQASDSLQAIVAGALRGLQDTRIPALIAIVGYWLGGFASAIALMTLTDLGGFGVWIGLAIGLTVTAILLMLRWTGRDRFSRLGGRGHGDVPSHADATL